MIKRFRASILRWKGTAGLVSTVTSLPSLASLAEGESHTIENVIFQQIYEGNAYQTTIEHVLYAISTLFRYYKHPGANCLRNSNMSLISCMTSSSWVIDKNNILLVFINKSRPAGPTRILMFVWVYQKICLKMILLLKKNVNFETVQKSKYV